MPYIGSTSLQGLDLTGRKSNNGIDYFIQNKEKYHLTVSIGSTPLWMNNIGLLTFSNEINRLYTEGYIEYTDTLGKLDRELEIQYNHITIDIKHDSQKRDGKITPLCIDQEMIYDFIVDGFEILDDIPGAIKYKVYFKSQSYLDIGMNVDYTTWGKPTELESTTDIIKKLFDKSVTKPSNSFDSCKSDVMIKYISSNKESIKDMIQYLLNQTLFTPNETIDKSLRTIIYDDRTQQFHLYNIYRGGPDFGQMPPISINMYKNAVDIMQEDKINLGYVSKKSQLQGVLDAKNISTHTYNIESNKFESGNSINQQFINNIQAGDANGLTKYNTVINMNEYTDHVMQWNNNLSLYDRLFTNLTQTNGLIVNQYGYIGVIPGFKANVIISNNFPLTSKNKVDCDYEKTKYQSFGGIWNVFRVDHYINPQKSLFRQKLCLFRPTITP